MYIPQANMLYDQCTTKNDIHLFLCTTNTSNLVGFFVAVFLPLTVYLNKSFPIHYSPLKIVYTLEKKEKKKERKIVNDELQHTTE